MGALNSVDRRRVGTILHFSDSFATSLLLPILPSVIYLFLGEGTTTAWIMLWIGLVTFGFTLGRAGILVFARVRSLDPPLPRLYLIILVLLLLGISHLSCGFIILGGRHYISSVVWLLLGRFVAGIMSGCAYLVGIGCLFSDNTDGNQNWDPISRDTQVEAWGLLCGVGTGGFLWALHGDHQPLFWVGLIPALLHGAAVFRIVIDSCWSPRGKRMYETLVDRGEGALLDSENDTVSWQPLFEDHAEQHPNSPSTIKPPGRYIRGCGGDEIEALRRWKLTLSWRKSEHVDSILDEKQLHFDAIKKYYPHYIYGRAKSGSPVYYDFPGSVDVKGLKSAGIGVPDLVRHFIFNTEYLWKVVEPNDDAQCVTVLDMTGVAFRDIQGGDKVNFFKATSHVTQEHYVERCEKLFIINAPSFFSLAWRAASPMLNENTRKKISVCRKGQHMSDLLTSIDASEIPLELGGECTSLLSESNEEKQLRELVASRLRDDGCISGSKFPDGSLEIEQPIRSNQYNSSDNVYEEDVKIEDIEYQNNYSGFEDSSLPPQEEKPKLLRWIVGLAKGFKRPAVRHAYVGETNRYFYDNETHAWVMRQDKDTARNRLTFEQSSSQCGGESSFFNSGVTFYENGGTNEEEELTVMAIQAAQLAHSTLKSTPRMEPIEDSDLEGWADVEKGSPSSKSTEPVEEKVIPWLGFISMRSNMNDMAPSLASAWYLILVAIQTIVPTWLLFPIDAGGLGWHTREVTTVLLMMGGGMALIRAAIASNLTSKCMEREGAKRINTGILIHVITIIPLCAFSAIMSKKTSAVLACAIAAWTAVTVSLNGTLLLLCRSQRLATCRHFHSEGNAAWMDCRSLLFSEVGGSMLGPMVVALCCWLDFGVGISTWFPFCVAIDMLLWVTAKPVKFTQAAPPQQPELAT